jgi:hypothetical protein
MIVSAKNLCIPLVVIASAVTYTADSQVESERTGSISGLVGDTIIELTDVRANYKPDDYSESCVIGIANWNVIPESVTIVFLAPCIGLANLVGMEFRLGDSEIEYIQVSVDFEFNERRTGGRHRTVWEAAGTTMKQLPIVVRLTGFDGEFLSGEVLSELPLRRIDGSLPNSRRGDRFGATFSARVEVSSEAESDSLALGESDR